MPRSNGWICFLCDKVHRELEDAEMCERQHRLEHDAHCPCYDCRHERAADTAKDMR